MRTENIYNQIQENFAPVYRRASKFVDSGELWEFCMETIKDPIAMGNIVFANDMGVPPVKSLITIYERKHNTVDNFTVEESKNLGALMGFVFKNVLGYKEQKERCAVNQLGVKTATKFLDGPVWEFEK